MRTRPSTRIAASKSPNAIDGIEAVDLYLLALDAETNQPSGALEDEFVKHALSFARRRGITYAAWCDVGVPAHVLKRAGIAAETGS